MRPGPQDDQFHAASDENLTLCANPMIQECGKVPKIDPNHEDSKKYFTGMNVYE